MKHAVYKIINQVNNQTVYIGMTANPTRRWQEHQRALKKAGKRRGLYSGKHQVTELKMEVIQWYDTQYLAKLNEALLIITYHLEGQPLDNLTINNLKLRTK